MQAPLYQLEGVSRCYGATRALDRCSLSVPSGRVTGIAGPNGSGKSTLLSLLAFVERPDEGRVLFQGQEEHPFSPAVRHRVTLMPQTPFLLDRSVFDNVSYGLAVKKDRTDVAGRVRRALTRVGLDFDAFSGRRRNELSGGEAQRVALAARLILDPEVLILDEPTASVDAASSFLIHQAILAFAALPGKTVILTSHDAAWLDSVSDEVLFFFRGRRVTEKMGLMLFGPFAKDPASGMWAAGTGQGTIVVPEPPSADAVAAVPERCLRMGREEGAHEAGFDAEVRETALQKGRTGARVILTGAGFPLTLSCPANQLPEPGRTVRVSYPLDSVQWL
ncbi:ATP-binding cassette domain-containing protein [Desulfoluna spongiiphila]|uniref:Tungstate transport system ATP-binding protein n=1 Tax=Desulfoluna spongiiphila TaxID=419481 RepID=A0A1G5CQI5_9BACT|nr:ABC transporter ATP-binding protein [Desulfoluna spongiiphila]SCY04735.1 tungstate transport system ATP-binding protein [Desulfoluna spongiiphila]